MTSSNEKNFRVTGLCGGNPPVTGGFPSQRPVTQSFDVFFDVHLNKQLNKPSRCWWFATPWRSLWRHMDLYAHCIVNYFRYWWPMPVFPLCSPGDLYFFYGLFHHSLRVPGIHGRRILPSLWVEIYFDNIWSFYEKWLFSNLLSIVMSAGSSSENCDPVTHSESRC